jgi:hypothetical protein
MQLWIESNPAMRPDANLDDKRASFVFQRMANELWVMIIPLGLPGLDLCQAGSMACLDC